MFSAQAMEARCEHRLQHGEERIYLWKKREECERNPKRQCIIEIDGMDQRKTETPRIEERNKALDRCEVIKNHILGIYINGKYFFCISHRDHWKKDPNLTISVLFQAFKRLPTPWPLILYIQLDNCIGENKNINLFFICALLVHLQIFEMVCPSVTDVVSGNGFFGVFRNIISFYKFIETFSK
jgi:hypothetical protein